MPGVLLGYRARDSPRRTMRTALSEGDHRARPRWTGRKSGKSTAPKKHRAKCPRLALGRTPRTGRGPPGGRQRGPGHRRAILKEGCGAGRCGGRRASAAAGSRSCGAATSRAGAAGEAAATARRARSAGAAAHARGWARSAGADTTTRRATSKPLSSRSRQSSKPATQRSSSSKCATLMRPRRRPRMGAQMLPMQGWSGHLGK
mmetsp:Transcript_157582/g.505383  ORF Transcript_157582/g.505383 Transcript_157582/m.505383 type:complete len:203 (-) Transcript_157582:551-1159(-)